MTLADRPGVHPAAVIEEGVELADDAEVRAGAVVRAGTVVGPGCLIEEGALVGKAPRLGAASTARRDAPPPARLGARVTVCAGAVVYAGADLADDVIVGDGAQVRERTRLGERTVVGRASSVDNDVRVGARVKLQTGVYLTAYSEVEDDVFLGPGALTTNDDTMGRHPPGEPLRGATLRRACRIGGAAVLVPGVEVGEEAFVAAGALVTRDVPGGAVVMGVPARVVRTVPDADLLERWR